MTGAAGGIGRAVAERLLARGDHVIACARKIDQIADLGAAGAMVLAIDVASDESVRAGFAGLTNLDAVVHCAAQAPLGTVEFTSPAHFAEIFNINTLGALRILQVSAPLLRQATSGRIIVVSSLWGRVSGPFVSSYAASKHAIEAIADSFRRETGNEQVRLSIIEPGVVLTKMFDQQVPELDRQIAALGVAEAQLYGEIYCDHRNILAKAGKGATTAKECARRIELCLNAKRPKPRYVIGKDSKVMVVMGRLMSDRALDWVFGRLYKSTPA
ncbi:SDR family NAD(P)-dependent oxidoreductase [Parasphingorhabdus sp.]|uniref:SDR family NAD(P)-dependent oxidoreductase n=1 Tax=Parasphingorhabdus sp. TaxID=2709688 RepID=UPI0032EF3732